MDTKVIAQQIWQAVGGKDNVESLVYCATRLRFVLNDDTLVDESSLTAIREVTGTFRTSGQYQIILGLGTVRSIYEALHPLLDAKDETSSETLNPVQKAMKVLSGLVGKE